MLIEATISFGALPAQQRVCRDRGKLEGKITRRLGAYAVSAPYRHRLAALSGGGLK